MGEQTVFQQALALLEPYHVRHIGRDIYGEVRVTLDGKRHSTRVWQREGITIRDYLSVVVIRDPVPDAINQDMEHLVQKLAQCDEPEFPIHRENPDPRWTAWENGWYFSGDGELDHASDLHSLFTSICCAGKRIDPVVNLLQEYAQPLCDLFVPYDRPWELFIDPSCSPVKYFPQTFRTDPLETAVHQGIRYRNFMQLSTATDEIFKVQQYSELDVKIAYGLLGGLQQPNNGRKILLHLVGTGGSGKSELMTGCQRFYPYSSVTFADVKNALPACANVKNMFLHIASGYQPKWNLKLVCGSREMNPCNVILAGNAISPFFYDKERWANHLVILDFPHSIPTVDGGFHGRVTSDYDRFYRKCALANYLLLQMAQDNASLWQKCLKATRFEPPGIHTPFASQKPKERKRKKRKR
jgi:hypothetical protein